MTCIVIAIFVIIGDSPHIGKREDIVGSSRGSPHIVSSQKRHASSYQKHTAFSLYDPAYRLIRDVGRRVPRVHGRDLVSAWKVSQYYQSVVVAISYQQILKGSRPSMVAKLIATPS